MVVVETEEVASSIAMDYCGEGVSLRNGRKRVRGLDVTFMGQFVVGAVLAAAVFYEADAAHFRGMCLSL